MSNVIKDVEKIHQRQLQSAKQRNERDIKSLENAHQDYRADLKKAHAEEIVDIQNVNHTALDKEAEKKEKVLAEMRNHLAQSKSMTEKELKTLKDFAEKEKIETHQKLTVDRDRINDENQLYLEEMNHRYNQSAKKIDSEGKRRVEELLSNSFTEYNEAERFSQDKLLKQTSDFSTRFNHDARTYDKLKKDQDKQFKTERMATNLRQQVELAKSTDTHTKHIETRDGEYRKGLKEQDLFFEKKYAHQLDSNNQEFKTMETRKNKVIDALKENLTQEIAKASSRNDDPFYKFETLKPRLRQFEDRVEVEVEIPEHSKQDVKLSINGKEAVLSFNRRFADASKAHDGTINKINKVESFTTRLQTGHFLDAKSLRSSFEDGVMTYVIKKA